MEADIIFCIFGHLTFFDIIRYALVNKQINNISKNELLWKRMSERDYPGIIDSEYVKNYRGYYKLFKFLRSTHKFNYATTKTKFLTISGIDIKSLPREICLLTNLQELYLHNNNLSVLPTELSRLTNLVRLDLDYNELESIPNELSSLTNLHTLFVSGSQVRLIPECVKKLPQLKVLIN
jgi:Leucine-rich repeat (LRR) protein